jgi:hypothetical protein
LRKQLAGLDPEALCRTTEGLYTEERTRETYATMLVRAEEALESKRGVILDATFPRRADRDGARMLAERHGVPFLLVECRCDEAEIRKRLDERVRRHLGPSDADWDVYVEQRRRAEPFSGAERDRLVIEATRDVDSQTRAVEEALLAPPALV